MLSAVTNYSSLLVYCCHRLQFPSYLLLSQITASCLFIGWRLTGSTTVNNFSSMNHMNATECSVYLPPKQLLCTDKTFVLVCLAHVLSHFINIWPLVQLRWCHAIPVSLKIWCTVLCIPDASSWPKVRCSTLMISLVHTEMLTTAWFMCQRPCINLA